MWGGVVWETCPNSGSRNRGRYTAALSATQNMKHNVRFRGSCSQFLRRVVALFLGTHFLTLAWPLATRGSWARAQILSQGQLSMSVGKCRCSRSSGAASLIPAQKKTRRPLKTSKQSPRAHVVAFILRMLVYSCKCIDMSMYPWSMAIDAGAAGSPPCFLERC